MSYKSTYNRALANRARSAALRLYEQQKAGGPIEFVEPEPEEEIEESIPTAEERLNTALQTLRDGTFGTPYSGNLWIVGGYVRDKILGLHAQGNDVDLVMQSNALELAHLLNDRGLTEIAPVVYPRFGTAMVRVAGCDVELVTARKESYAEGSRKPAEIEPATLEEDAVRRDFTINTLLENLHSGEIVDPLGQGLPDLTAKCLRTPLPPDATFADDPLRMLRAVRFAARLGFEIAPSTWDAMIRNVKRLAPPTVSWERIQAEFSKMLMAPSPSHGLEMLRRSGLVDQIAPELGEMVGVTQNEFHSLPVWDHTLLALDNLVAGRPDAPLVLRLATLMHDVGKPSTKSVGEDGRIHFYGHQDAGAKIARKIMARLKYSNEDCNAVEQLVAQHMRIGEYNPQRWTDAAVRRLVRETGEHLPNLFDLHRADVSALSDEHQDMSRAEALKGRIDALESELPSGGITSPLTGEEIMQALGIASGPEVGKWKERLTNQVIEGHLSQDDKEGARRLIRADSASPHLE